MPTQNGTPGPDTLIGTPSDDSQFGFGGADILDGREGADLMVGGDESDDYYVDNTGDETVEDPTDGDTDRVFTRISYTLVGGSGVEFFGIGVRPGSGDPDPSGLALNLTGNELSQTIQGNNAANIIDGGGSTGAGDILIGGGGDDIYLVHRAEDSVVENLNGGNDVVFARVSYALTAGAYVEVLSTAVQSQTTAINLTGNAFAQTIYGNYGNNVIVGGFGNDTMIGLLGNDTYVVQDAGDVIQEGAGEGTDVVFVSAADVRSYTLTAGASIETLSAQNQGGAAYDRVHNPGDPNSTSTTQGRDGAELVLVGNAFSQTIIGDQGDNDLTGGGGADTLIGLGGDDDYHVDSQDDVIVEAVGGNSNQGNGGDYVYTTVNYELAAGVEIELLTVEGLNFDALGGDDGGSIFDPDLGNVTTTNINLTGNEFSQEIYGNNGNNILDAGNDNKIDFLVGLKGDDIYRVYAQNDVVYEYQNRGHGLDIIFTSASYSLLASDAFLGIGAINDDFYTEIEVLAVAQQSGTQAINLTGNEYGQKLIGNYGDNILNGVGDAALATTDTLVGLLGNDTYIVNHLGDIVLENAGEGTDVVQASTSYKLNAGASVEALSTTFTTGTAAINLEGNELSQTITGNDGDNILNTGGGAGDTLIGRLGNDTYRVYSQADVIVELAGQGNDALFTSGSYDLANGVSIELMSTAVQGDTTALNLTGNELNQTIIGNNGNNILNGDGSTTGDTLIGLLGNDSYRVYNANDKVVEGAGGGSDSVFSSASYTLYAGQQVETLSAESQAATFDQDLRGNEFANTIIGSDGRNVLDGGLGNDLLVGLGRQDTFAFSTALNGTTNVDTIDDFTVGSDIIGLDSTIFAAVGGTLDASEFVVGTAAQDANDRIIYNSATGQLFYDADGAGGADQVLFAVLDAGLGLAAIDFTVGSYAYVPPAI